MSRPIPQQCPSEFHAKHIYLDPWYHAKSHGDLEFSGLDGDMSDYGHGLVTADDDTTLIDLRRISYLSRDHAHDIFTDSSRRMSESTTSMSSYGPFADVPHFDDSPPSENTQLDSDWAAFDTSTRYLDPTSSPRPTSLYRSASRARVSPAPSLRSSPYTLESTRNKRWSTGMYPGQPPPPKAQHPNRYSSYFGPSPSSHPGFSSLTPESIPTLPTQDYLYPSAHLRPSSLICPTSEPFPEVARPLPSQGMFRMLQSNVDRLPGCFSHCADLSDPPDLYSSLSETPSDPPEEDMKPEDPDMIPHEQELRFPGDLYTPKWVRGQGNKREGWCGLCKPGRWLVLKNSAFWYDKSFTHGVSAATGAAFHGPQDTRRTEGNLDIWEGLCGSCHEWIALVSSKKKGTTWFRHAYKCHTHAKVKDGPKRRKEAATTTLHTTETRSTIEPTITLSSSTPTPSAELPAHEITVGESEPCARDMQGIEIKCTGEETPMSTPQLSCASLSTPQPTWTHTPSSMNRTSVDRKRYSMVFDSSPLSTPFSTRLESFAEHEAEHMSSDVDYEMTSGDSFDLSADAAPLFPGQHGSFPHDMKTVLAAGTTDNFNTSTNMATSDTSHGFFFSPQPHFDSNLEFKTSQPPDGNWI